MNNSKQLEAKKAPAVPAVNEVLDLMNMTPKQMLVQASEAAKALQDMIEQNKEEPLTFNGQVYLRYPHWQTIGKFFHVSAATEDAVYVEVGGYKGFKAKAKLIDDRTGLIVGSAEAYCLNDEPNWDKRPIYKYNSKTEKREIVGEQPVPLFQLASMAQTRAGSKAHSNKFRYVAVLAGYQATPAEEVEEAVSFEYGTAVPAGTPAKKGAPKIPVQAPQAKPAVPTAAAPAPAPAAAPAAPVDQISEDQQIQLFARLKRGGIPNDVLRRYIVKEYNVERTEALSRGQLERIHAWLDQLNIAR